MGKRAFTRFVAVAALFLWANGVVAEEFSIRTKSFINSIDTSQLSPGRTLMAKAVWGGTLGAEDPSDSEESTGHYRLFSEVVYDATCRAGKVRAVRRSHRFSGGSEAVFLNSTTKWDVEPVARATDTEVSLSYRMKGEPHAAGNTAMVATGGPRNCTWIWHEVVATFTCVANTPKLSVKLMGSAFPSHRLWVNEACKYELNQGSFGELWHCQAPPAADTKQIVAGGPASACN